MNTLLSCAGPYISNVFTTTTSLVARYTPEAITGPTQKMADKPFGGG